MTKKRSASSRSKRSQAEWVWLIYMAGDNDLESAGKSDLRELKSVGSTDDVHVIVQFDTKKNHTTRFRVAKGSLTTLQSMRDTNTGSSATLAEFIRWGLAEFPAKRILLDIWNHGGGWENLPEDFDYESLRAARPRSGMRVQQLRRALFRTTVEAVYDRGETTRAIAIDTGSHDYLDNQELRKAIRAGIGANRKVDLLGLDACLMNMLEVAYELRDVAGIMVGSEETEPAAGWPYAAILKKLVGRPKMSARELAPIVVREYGAYFTRAKEVATQSALDLGAIDAVVRCVDRVADALLPAVRGGDSAVIGQVLRARAATLHFEDSPEYLDLGDLCRQLVARMPQNTPVVAAANATIVALSVDATKGFVIANTRVSRAMARASGVSIFFPFAKDENAPDYAALQFSKKSRWNELLDAVLRS